MPIKKRMNTITVIVETPKGQGLKYGYDPIINCFKLNKIMPAGLVFPFDFGYIPATTGGDGDPVDVLIISEVSTFAGCAIDCRIIGGIKASQRERKGLFMSNDRIIVVPEVSLQYAGVDALKDLPKHLIGQLEIFFENYNQQAGKKFQPLKRLTAAQAAKIVGQAHDNSVKDILVQLFIPLNDENGALFPEHYYTKLSTDLNEKFGGVTLYNRSPATGLWKQKHEKTVQDELLVYEILIAFIDNEYWQALKARLEKQFNQTELLILLTKIQKL